MFEINDDRCREEIKQTLTRYLDTKRHSGEIYDFNVLNETTQEMIDSGGTSWLIIIQHQERNYDFTELEISMGGHSIDVGLIEPKRKINKHNFITYGENYNR